MIKHLPNFDKKILALFLVCLSILSLTLYEEVSALSAPSRNSVVTPGGQTIPCNYVNYVDGSTFLGKNGQTGDNDYSGSDAGAIINSEIAVSSVGSVICLTSGIFTGSDVNINKPLILRGAGIGVFSGSNGIPTGENDTSTSPTVIKFAINVNNGNNATSLQGVTIQDLWLSIIDSPNRNKVGILLYGTKFSSINNVAIQGFGEGIRIDGANLGGYENQITHSKIIDNIVGAGKSMTYGVRLTASAGNLPNFNWIDHSRIAVQVGIYNQLGTDNKITFNDLSNNLNSSIRSAVAGNAARLTIEHNFFENLPTVLERDPPTGAFAGLQMIIRDNAWGTGITNKFGVSGGTVRIFPQSNSIISDTGLLCGTQAAPLVPGNTVDFCASMWAKVVSGTVLVRGANTKNYNTYLTQDLGAPCVVDVRTNGGIFSNIVNGTATSYEIVCLSTSNTNQLQISIYMTNGFTLTSDFLMYVRLF